MIEPATPSVHGTVTRAGRCVGIARKHGFHSVVATEPIDSGTVILEIDGVFADRPSMYSIQVDEHLHIEVPESEASSEEPERHPWRYLNHSCNPNTAMAGLKLIALRPIRAWEQITFDYNTTELEMSTPFDCNCGHCGGETIRGFKFLPADRQHRLYPQLAEYLRRKLNGNGAC